MDLIHLYVAEVGRHLPEKMRTDIEREIRSLIEDTLEDECQATGRPADEEMIVEVLKRFGSPEKVAASYLPPRYLIGPELFPHFVNTLRIVVSIVVVLASLAIGLSLGARGSEQTILDVFAGAIGGVLDAAFRAASLVVLIFAILQFASPGFRIKEEEWDPRKMKTEPDPERVSLPGTLVEVVFSILALVIFNFYPQWIGVILPQNGELVPVPFLTQAFFRYLPFLSILWILGAGHKTWLAAQGRWTVSQRWVSAALGSLTILVMAWMLTGPAIVSIPVETLTALGWGIDPQTTNRLSEGVATSVRLVFGMIIALEVLEVGKHLYKLLVKRLPQPILSQ